MTNEQLRELCLSFPHATEDVKWGTTLCFSVGGKMFCTAGTENQAGQISFKCTPEKFSDLVERDGIIPAPKVAKFHWVAVEVPTVLDAEEYEDLISRSYLLVYENLPRSEQQNPQES